MLILVLVFVGVIVAMMDCAKRTMRKKKIEPRQEGGTNGMLYPGPSQAFAGLG